MPRVTEWVKGEPVLEYVDRLENGYYHIYFVRVIAATFVIQMYCQGCYCCDESINRAYYLQPVVQAALGSLIPPQRSVITVSFCEVFESVQVRVLAMEMIW